MFMIRVTHRLLISRSSADAATKTLRTGPTRYPFSLHKPHIVIVFASYRRKMIGHVIPKKALSSKNKKSPLSLNNMLFKP